MNKLLLAVDLVGLLLIYFVSLLPRWRGDHRCLILNTLIYFYLCAVLYLTLLPLVFSFNLSYARLNLVAFYDFRAGHRGAMREFLLNILMLVPLGILAPLAGRKKGFFATVGLALLLSASIETLQLFCGYGSRSCDVTDLISNTLGGILGYLIYFSLRKPLNRLFGKRSRCTFSRHCLRPGEIVLYSFLLLQLLPRTLFA